MLKVLSLFSGIGAFEKALNNLNVSYELVGFSEINEKSSLSYCAIHNVSSSLNIGDITKINISNLPDFDLLIGGPPCQAFSMAGKRKGLSDERGRLSFLFIEVLKRKQPLAFIFENVKGLLSIEKGDIFLLLLKEFNEAGYVVSFKILNSKYFQSGQNRERVYVIGVRKDVVDASDVLLDERGLAFFSFPFPKEEKVDVVISDVMEDEVDGKYMLPLRLIKDIIPRLDASFQNPSLKLKDLKLAGNIEQLKFGLSRRVYFTNGVSPALTTSQGGNTVVKIAYKENGEWVVRFLTPREYWRLQRFSDEDVDKVLSLGLKDRHLYFQAGNSITVSVLEAIFPSLLKKIS